MQEFIYKLHLKNSCNCKLFLAHRNWSIRETMNGVWNYSHHRNQPMKKGRKSITWLSSAHARHFELHHFNGKQQRWRRCGRRDFAHNHKTNTITVTQNTPTTPACRWWWWEWTRLSTSPKHNHTTTAHPTLASFMNRPPSLFTFSICGFRWRMSSYKSWKANVKIKPTHLPTLKINSRINHLQTNHSYNVQWNAQPSSARRVRC